MSTISLCMIVKDEEEVIERCLESAKHIVDEIIIVDTGSKDSTKELCKKYTNKIYDFEWCDNFSLARNYSFSKASCEYIMWLDADDIIPLKSIKKLKKLKHNLTFDTYMLSYDIGFLKNKTTFTYFRERIIKNCSLAIWQGHVHECIAPFGKIKFCNISIEHRKIKNSNSDRNLKIYEKLINFRQLNPRELYYYGRELYDHKKYDKCITTLTEFLNNNNGWIENKIDACLIIAKCYKALNNKNKEIEFLFKTFIYDTPRANICCAIGDWFIYNKQYKLSISWYLMATRCIKKTRNGQFMEPMYYKYYPYLQLCLAYYNLGDVKKSEEYNLKADKQFSTEITQNNKKFFESLKQEKTH